jgi:protein required for attachment to host cells
MKAKVTWILIADGATAKVFEHHGPGKGLHAVDDLMFAQTPLKAGEIMADRPGRSFQSFSNGRSAMESPDPVAVRERRFVETVAEELERKHQQRAFDQLIVVAAPTALGDLRPALSKGLRDTIVAELPKDLTNLPTAQLGQHFDGLLAM